MLIKKIQTEIKNSIKKKKLTNSMAMTHESLKTHRYIVGKKKKNPEIDLLNESLYMYIYTLTVLRI